MELSLSKFFFDIPIYTPIEINDSNKAVLRKIMGHSNDVFDGYNPWKQVESTFVVASRSDITDTMLSYANIAIKCKRTDILFRYSVLWDPIKSQITKIGQHPSVADFHISEIKHYKKILPNEKLKEFTRAIGLAANGVGIGSFVYLRRIFEFLIHDTYKLCLSEGIVSEDQYNRSRMDEKIGLLSDHLPRFLVDNKSIYSILSLGIHELDEELCLSHFDALRVGIEIILDEKLDELKKKEKIEAAKKKLSALKSEITGS